MKKKNNKYTKWLSGTFGFISTILIILAVVAFGPMLLIWSLNTLLGLGIAHSLSTYAAVYIITLYLAAVNKWR